MRKKRRSGRVYNRTGGCLVNRKTVILDALLFFSSPNCQVISCPDPHQHRECVFGIPQRLSYDQPANMSAPLHTTD